uniref:stress response protein NST1-like isoform X2 n=1 Tax=Orbicella faveolata TaxID=48498 RepID=UPI0009E3D859|nr:stress response protein NST1-like isoform X2 [Orbicella faveolata]
MLIKDYRTSAMLYTVALRYLEADSSPGLVAAILCKRAECLLRLSYVQHVLRDCRDAKSKLGSDNEHIAFLSSQALELQGEVQKAFMHAVIYKSLDPRISRDKDIMRRLRMKVKWLCGQGYHQVHSTLDVLMTQGELSLSDSKTKVALAFFTEVVNLFPEFPDAHEYRAKCFSILGEFLQAEQDCNRALNLTQRTSAAAFDTKIKIKIRQGEFAEALELVNEWQFIDPENAELDMVKMQMTQKLVAAQPRSGTAEMSRCQSPKNKKELQREERQREKERQEIARELGERRKQEESKSKKVKAQAPTREEQHGACEKTKGAVATEDTTPSMATPAALPGERPSFPERSRKRKMRRKTRTLRTARQGTQLLKPTVVVRNIWLL